MELPPRQGPFSIGSIAPGDTSLPPKIGGYKVLRRLATGGTSDVLLARGDATSAGPKSPERIVVLKLLLRQYREDPTFERMFAREAGAYARLSHPAIVKLYDFFGEAGQLVMVLEYVDGFPLHKLRALLKVRGQQLDARASAFLASRIFSALSAAHTARDPQSGSLAPVIHRDVNPSNVLVPWDGLAKIADFGIAKVTGVDGESQTGFIKGTYGYMAPEQVRGEEVTARADVYAGCLLVWELLAGRKAILRGSQSDVEVLRAMAEPRIPTLSTLRPDLPKTLLDAVSAGLAPDPGRRIISAAEVFQVLATSMNLDEGRAALVEALAGVRPPAPIDDSVTPPPPILVGPSSADATIPNPLAVQKALASSNAEAVIERRSQSTKPAAFKGGTLVMGQSPVAVPSPPRPPLTRPPPRPNPSAAAPSVAPPPEPAPPPPPAPPPAPVVSPNLEPPPPPANVAFLPGPWAPEAPLPAAVSPLARTVAASDPFPSMQPPPAVRVAPAPAAPPPAAAPPPPSPAGSAAMLGPGIAAAPAYGAPVVLPRTGRRRRRSSVWWLVGGAVVVAAGGAVGVAIGILQPSDGHPTAPAASVDSSATAATASATAMAASETHAAASVATAPPVAIPSSAAPSPSVPELPPIAATMGRITVPPDRGGHRVWFDKHIVGESPGSFDVPCGQHTVQVGSGGTVQKVDVACGVETEVR